MAEKNQETFLRNLVLDILLAVQKEEEFSHIAVRNVLEKYNYLETREKALIKRLAEGTLEQQIRLDYVIDCYSKTKVKKMKPVIRCIIEMGVYQILFMDIYDTVACNEAVNLAKKRGLSGLSGFVNGLLRTIVRQKESIVYPKKEDNLLFYLSIFYSIPQWLVSMWLEQYGDEMTEKMMRSFMEEKPVSVRLDETLPSKTKEEWLAKVCQSGTELREHPYLPYAYTIQKTDSIQKLPGYYDGFFAVQDVSSMLVAECVGIVGGERVLDVCAAPGGKTMHVACKLKGTGSVEARDVSIEKVEQIRENVERMKLKNITCLVADATVEQADHLEAFDVVIADLPCSGLGVIGKKQDIKYRISPEGIKEIMLLQRRILGVVQKYVKPGGVLIFSTCTINIEENENNADWFAKSFPFQKESVANRLPVVLREFVSESGTLQLIPGIHSCDGFFLSKFVKNI